MVTDRLEREQALDTIAQLRQQQRHLHAEQDLHSPKNEAPRLTQHIAELDKRVADLALTNDELSTDLGRALDVAQRVMDQKAKLQEQCQSQEQQLLHWQAEAERVKELEGGVSFLLCFGSQGEPSPDHYYKDLLFRLSLLSFVTTLMASLSPAALVCSKSMSKSINVEARQQRCLKLLSVSMVADHLLSALTSHLQGDLA